MLSVRVELEVSPVISESSWGFTSAVNTGPGHPGFLKEA